MRIGYLFYFLFEHKPLHVFVALNLSVQVQFSAENLVTAPGRWRRSKAR